MSKVSKVLVSLTALVPSLALAANTFRDIDGGVSDVLDAILYWTNTYIIPILIGVGVVVFFYGIVKYILGQGDMGKQKEARGLMVWGIVALFVMVSVWGLVKVLQNTFDIQNTNTIQQPIVPGTN